MLIDDAHAKCSDRDAIHKQIAENLAQNGWCITDDFLPLTLIESLVNELTESVKLGELRPASIGRGQDRKVVKEQRNDWIKWLEIQDASTAQQYYLDAVDLLRVSLNRSLYLGMVDYECHFALYPPGGYYLKHLDQFKDKKSRLLTCILYLNQEWTHTDGGALRLYTDPGDDERYQEILPMAGRLVTFFSARFIHAVMPSNRERLSVTGWFKSNIPIV
jgi:SM-20-related protein